MCDVLDPGSIDVVVTSPPYNLGINYRSYDDTAPREEYLNWMQEWGESVDRVLSRDGSLFLNIGGKPSEPWGPFEVLSRLRTRFVLQNTFHWVKSIAIDAEAVGGGSDIKKNVAVGHYKPINSKRFVNDCHEYVFHLTKTGDVELDRLAIGVEYQDKSNIARWSAAKDDLRCRGNTWFVPYATIQSRDRERPHPATFPIRIPQMCVLIHGVGRVRRVLDPFLGLGHSALACKALEIPFVGFELDEGYYSEACYLIEHVDPCERGNARGRQMSLF
jgi:site-specific DNA-methyltransferase (adenine-specific)